MKKSVVVASILTVILLTGACGVGEGGSSGDGDGDGDGDTVGDGDAPGDGDAEGDGDAGDGGGVGDGDASGNGGSAGDGDVAGSGGSFSDGGSSVGGGVGDGGTASTGGTESTGGTQNSSGGGPGFCDCDAVSVPVCGVDGNNYDAGCGDECVPVDIECEGLCPCEGCGCEVIGAGCEAGMRTWSCMGNSYSDAAFLAQGCESVPVGSIRYCCGIEVVPADFCQE